MLRWTSGLTRFDHIRNEMGILDGWVQYFDKSFNNQNIGEFEVLPTKDDGQILPPPSMEETVCALHWLKNHKSPGTDGMTVELVKYGGRQLHQAAQANYTDRYHTVQQL